MHSKTHQHGEQANVMEDAQHRRRTWRGLEVGWTTYEYAIVQTFQRMEYLLIFDEQRIYTDHRNLFFYGTEIGNTQSREGSTMGRIPIPVPLQDRARGRRNERHGRYHGTASSQLKLQNYIFSSSFGLCPCSCAKMDTLESGFLICLL